MDRRFNGQILLILMTVKPHNPVRPQNHEIFALKKIEPTDHHGWQCNIPYTFLYIFQYSFTSFADKRIFCGGPLSGACAVIICVSLLKNET